MNNTNTTAKIDTLIRKINFEHRLVCGVPCRAADEADKRMALLLNELDALGYTVRYGEQSFGEVTPLFAVAKTAR